jgi:hypothetical protein
MYVAVRRYEGVHDPQKVGQLVEQGFIPIISEMPGFVAYYCVDAGDGVIVSTSVFVHKDAEEQSTFRAGEFVAEDLGLLSPNPPQVTAGEVVANKAGRRETETKRFGELDVREGRERCVYGAPARKWWGGSNGRSRTVV